MLLFLAESISEEGARDLVLEFFEFRKLILSIDPPDEDDLDTSLNATATEGPGSDDKPPVGGAPGPQVHVDGMLLIDIPLVFC